MTFHIEAPFWKDWEALQKEDRKLGAKVLDFMEEIRRTPFKGLGKPEPLKNNLSGRWSRRITDKHRLVYEVIGSEIHLYSCYGHYGDE
jgi:toxin YoeB